MSNVVELTEEQKRLIEKLGVWTEKHGMPPAPARVGSLLLVSPETELTFDEIRETLNLSKSAASNAINLLLNTERIEYITRPGDRKRYFRSKISKWKEEMQGNFKNIYIVAELLEEVLKQRPGYTPEFNTNLKEAIGFMRFISEEIPALYEKWERSKK